jgi:hypothetical protein
VTTEWERRGEVQGMLESRALKAATLEALTKKVLAKVKDADVRGPKDIARALGVSVGKVQTILRKAGVRYGRWNGMSL